MARVGLSGKCKSLPNLTNPDVFRPNPNKVTSFASLLTSVFDRNQPSFWCHYKRWKLPI